MNTPKFSYIRYSNSHGCHFLNQYDPIPYNQPAVLKLEDGSFLKGKFVNRGFEFPIGKGTKTARLCWLEVGSATVAVDTTNQYKDLAHKARYEAKCLLQEAKELEKQGQEERKNFEAALALVEK